VIKVVASQNQSPKRVLGRVPYPPPHSGPAHKTPPKFFLARSICASALTEAPGPKLAHTASPHIQPISFNPRIVYTAGQTLMSTSEQTWDSSSVQPPELSANVPLQLHRCQARWRPCLLAIKSKQEDTWLTKL
jgi:hypothetical protein